MKTAIRYGIATAVLLAWTGNVPAGGNGAPSGDHYNLNILGKDRCSGDDLTGSNRHTIQVLLRFSDGSNNNQSAVTLDKRNKIYLSPGDFKVLDGNACDSDGAKFQLPAGGYEIFARALGTPGGSATMTTCATDPGLDETFDTADDVIVCSTENVVLVRTKGKSTFQNVTQQLTTLLLDTDGDTVGDTRVNLFDPALQDYFWDYDNNGLRLTQLRFYPL
jgi:hypothetical protein